MRKTSQDGGDATSATSGVENEMKKPKSGLLLEFKSKKIGKRTAPNLSEESDDAVVEPLLQKTTDKAIQSAKYFAKAKADTVKEISKLFNDKKAQSASTSGFGTTESLLSEKEQMTPKTIVSNQAASAPLHNYMNTNVFHSHENSKANGTTKTQVLVEIDATKQSGYHPSPLIFTTAKIHTDGKSKHMEPVQMTPAPILSTIEVSVSKGGNIITNEKKISNGTSVMNTVFTQPHVNEKTKENTVHISGSTFKQSKDIVLTDNNSNPTTSLPAKEKPQTEVGSHSIEETKDSTANVTKSNNMTPVARSKEVISIAANSSKSVTAISNHPTKSSLQSEASKSTSFDVENNQDLTKDVKETKKLVDEPRILMSESKLKSIISENTKPDSVTTTKPPQEPIKAVEPLTKPPLSIQSNKMDMIQSETNKSSLEQDIKVKNTEIIGSQPSQIKNIKSSVNKDATKPNTVTSKLVQQKNTAIEKSTSKLSENLNDSSAKTVSSSTKIPTQSKVIDNKLGKEIDKSPKPSANEITKPTSKISINNTASPSTNKTSTSGSITKPTSNVSLSNVTSSTTQAINSLPSGNVRTMTTTVATNATANVSASSVKAQSTSSKAATTTVNTKLTPVTTAKSSTKTSAASIKSSPAIKSPQISTSAAKQSTVTVKSASVKPPPLASTKTSQVNTSSSGVTAPIAKSVSKVAQVSTSAGQKNNPPPTLPSSSTSNESSNKTKVPESNKKVGSKPSDHAKDKVSKA